MITQYNSVYTRIRYMSGFQMFKFPTFESDGMVFCYLLAIAWNLPVYSIIVCMS